MAEKILFDGITSFIGGMNTAVSPSLLSSNQYVFSVNMSIPKSKEGIETRGGFVCAKLNFHTNKERDIFKSGKVQGSGYYIFENKIIIVLSINGYIIKLHRINKFEFDVEFTQFKNNKNIKHCYIAKIPNGAIVNDGESGAILLGANERRLSLSNNEIGPGLAGIYVQNRFFYIHPNKKLIMASTIKEPWSLQEAIDANIYGFDIPDETEDIIAIGKQKTISKDATGGSLIFASNSAIYSVDVRGARSNWGVINNSNVGAVSQEVTDFGAISPFSFESANSNIYFRNPRHGFMSTKSSQYQFINNDTFSPVSIESSLLFDNDTKEFLHSCYTKIFKTKLFTTVAPQLKEDGSIYWNGLLVISPDIYFATKDRAEINRLESIYTGVRPTTILSTVDQNSSEGFFIMSYDEDNINRLYLIDESINYDINHKGNPIQIEQKLLTRLFNFGNSFYRKKNHIQFYGLSSRLNPQFNTNIKIFTRDSDVGPFKEIHENEHSNCSKCLFEDQFNERGIFNFGDSLNNVIEKQDLFVINGPVNITKIGRSVILDGVDTNITPPSCEYTKIKSQPDKIFTYGLSDKIK